MDELMGFLQINAINSKCCIFTHTIIGKIKQAHPRQSDRNHVDNIPKMILKFEIIIYCTILTNASFMEAENFSKDFAKKVHDKEAGKNRDARCT